MKKKFRIYFVMAALLFGPGHGARASEARSTCQWKEKKVVILSAPALGVVHSLNLLEAPQVQAIVKTNPPITTGPNVELLPSTVFLASKTLAKFKDSTVIFDESRDLRNSLLKTGVAKMVEIKTRDLDPFEAMASIKRQLEMVTVNCQQEWREFSETVDEAKARASRLELPAGVLLFFLGHVAEKEKLPELMMNNDGPVKFLRQHLKREFYPSTLAYIGSSQKILSDLKKRNRLIFIGLNSEERELLTPDIQKGSDGSIYINIYRPEFLIPGSPAMMFLLDMKAILQIPELNR